MYNRGHKPIQGVFFLPRSVKVELNSRGLTNLDIMDFKKIEEVLSNNDLVNILILNSGNPLTYLDDKKSEGYDFIPNMPNGSGIDCLGKIWENTVEGDEAKLQRLVKIERIARNEIGIKRTYERLFTGINLTISPDGSIPITYEDKSIQIPVPFCLEYDENHIVVCVNTDLNLLDNTTRNRLYKFITYDVLKVLYVYHNSPNVSQTNWFNDYVYNYL